MPAIVSGHIGPLSKLVHMPLRQLVRQHPQLKGAVDCLSNTSRMVAYFAISTDFAMIQWLCME